MKGKKLINEQTFVLQRKQFRHFHFCPPFEKKPSFRKEDKNENGGTASSECVPVRPTRIRFKLVILMIIG